MIPATRTNEAGQRGGLLLAGLGAVALVRLWIVPLGSSLWIDEFGTWWVTHGRFDEILGRARLFPQSIPYAAIVWATRALGGDREIALRLPSLLAAGLAAYVLYRLGCALFDRETGLVAAAIFAAVPLVCFAAGDARPYAFAILATVGALWFLVRWLEDGRVADALGYVLLVGAAIYFQYLFAAMLPAQAAYAARRWRRGCRASGRQLVLAALGIVLLTAPAAPIVLEIGRERAIHAFAAMPGGRMVALTIVPTGILAAVLASLGVCWAIGRLVRRPLRLSWSVLAQGPGPAGVPVDDAVLLLSLSVLIPPVLLYAVSHIGGSSVFVDRYMASIVPAQALLIAWFLRAVEPIDGRRIVAAVYLLIMIAARGTKVEHVPEDWRGAIGAIRAADGAHPVLLAGPYTETRSLSRVSDAKNVEYMRAPLDYYAVDARTWILPRRVGPEAESYVERILGASDLQSGFVLLERSSRFPSWDPWLEERLKPKGYRGRKVWGQGSLRAWLFERTAPSARGPG